MDWIDEKRPDRAGIIVSLLTEKIKSIIVDAHELRDVSEKFQPARRSEIPTADAAPANRTGLVPVLLRSSFKPLKTFAL